MGKMVDIATLRHAVSNIPMCGDEKQFYAIVGEIAKAIDSAPTVDAVIVKPNRVLTMDEAGDILSAIEPVWLELKGVDGGIWAGNGDSIYVALKAAWRGSARSYSTIPEWDHEYGQWWRLWLRRPNEQERMAAEWATGAHMDAQQKDGGEGDG